MIIMRESERQINGLKDEIVKLCKETKWFADLDILILSMRLMVPGNSKECEINSTV